VHRNRFGPGDPAFAQDERAALLARLDRAGVPGGRIRSLDEVYAWDQTMAYKDEYEVARLCLDPTLAADAEARFGAGSRFAWQLHPPMLRTLGMDRKIGLGPWARPVLVALRGMRRVRGTRLHVFGTAHVRRVERELLVEYLAVLDELVASLGRDGARSRCRDRRAAVDGARLREHQARERRALPGAARRTPRIASPERPHGVAGRPPSRKIPA